MKVNVRARMRSLAPGIVVGPPEVSLAASLLQEHLLGVSGQFTAEAHHTALHVHHVLDHVAEEPKKADPVGTRDAPLEDKKIRRRGRHHRQAPDTLKDVRW